MLMCHTTLSYVWNDSFVRMKWLIHKWDDSIISFTVDIVWVMRRCSLKRVTRRIHIYITRLFHTHETTHPHIRWLYHLIYSLQIPNHDTLRIQMRDTTQSCHTTLSCVCNDSPAYNVALSSHLQSMFAEPWHTAPSDVRHDSFACFTRLFRA